MAKRKKPEKKPSQIWKVYNVSNGKVERKNTFCPKCGKGFFMAKHKDRLVCGNCYYTEFESGKIKDHPENDKPEEKSEEEPSKTSDKPEEK